MFDFFLSDTGGKLKFLAKVMVVATVIATPAVLLVGICAAVEELSWDHLVWYAGLAAGIFASGWIAALALQGVGETAEGISYDGRITRHTRREDGAHWLCVCGARNDMERATCSCCGAIKRGSWTQ